MEVLKLACRAAALNRDALHEALKDAAVRAQIEILKKREAELEAEVMDVWACWSFVISRARGNVHCSR